MNNFGFQLSLKVKRAFFGTTPKDARASIYALCLTSTLDK
jgi:hypothetical protein